MLLIDGAPARIADGCINLSIEASVMNFRSKCAIATLCIAVLASGSMAWENARAESPNEHSVAPGQQRGRDRATVARLDYQPPSCAFVKSHNSPRSELDKLEDDLEKNYPLALVEPARVEHVYLGRAQLAQIVMYLACLSTSSRGAFVPDQATALFASKRYGREAFRVLEREAASHGEDTKDAELFLWQMKEYMKPRTE